MAFWSCLSTLIEKDLKKISCNISFGQLQHSISSNYIRYIFYSAEKVPPCQLSTKLSLAALFLCFNLAQQLGKSTLALRQLQLEVTLAKLKLNIIRFLYYNEY